MHTKGGFHPDVPVVDGHLDLAENVTIFGRNLTRSIDEIRRKEKRTSNQATVSLPELEKGGIAIAFATVTPGFLVEDVGPDFEPKSGLYTTAEEAEAQALSQIDLYDQWERQARVRILRSVSDLNNHLELWKTDRKPGLVLLMEGADPIVDAEDLPKWWNRGLRAVGLTYGNTKYGTGVAGGSSTFKAGGITADGARLLRGIAHLGMIWDISHLTEEGILQGLELFTGSSLCASHANAQALTPTNRHLSDTVIQSVANRGGVIGLVLYNKFLEPAWAQDKTQRVSLEIHLRRQVEYMAKLAGWSFIGIGSDLDGGFGLEESPVEIHTIADLYKVGDLVPPAVREGVLGGNWISFLRKSLPA
jgi:membrane dipeptidase